MRVGIMTWFTYHNYGTALQVTALTSRVKALGHEPSVINYKPDSRMKSIKREGLFRFLAVRIVRRIAGLFRPRHRNYAPAEREEKFLSFLGENISLTEKCDTMQELEDVAKNFDAVICGSDQIWSPLGLDAHYYLDFVHDRAKKAAYAPSIDTNHVRSEAVRQRVIALAGDIAYLSVREKASAETLSLWLNRKVEAVLDPALLLKASEWEKYTYTNLQILPTGGGGYCLVYMLTPNDSYYEESRRIAGVLGLEVKVIPVFVEDLHREGCITSPVGPAEFLALFRDAAFVCTDSFHGMVFSIIFHVNFVEFERFAHDDPINQNFRIYNIAELLSLESRIFSGRVPDETLRSAIDFREVDRKLDKLREDSLCWLKITLDTISSIHSDKEV